MLADADLSTVADLMTAHRATMLLALLGGRPLTAGELAGRAGISPSLASSHLSKLLDGGLVDNYGLAGFTIARLASETPFGPLAPQEAVKLRRFLFLVVDSGRAPSGNWAQTIPGPSGVDLIMATSDTATGSGASGSGAAASGTGGSGASSSAAGSLSSSGTASSSSSSSSGFAEIVDTHQLTMTVAFSESDITKVKVGQPATVTLDALTGVELAAHVSSISTLGTDDDGVVSYDATLTLDQHNASVRPGMSASAAVITSQAQGVTLPSSAVTGDGSLATVDLLRAGRAVSTQVVVGIKGDSRTQIVSGLHAGQQVVVTTVLPSLTAPAASSSSVGGFAGLRARFGGGGFGGGGASGGGFAGGGFGGGGG